MAFLLRVSLLCLLIVHTAGCAHKTLVALVPDPDGEVGKVTVSSAAGTVRLSTPFMATTVAGAAERPDEPEYLGGEDLRKIFSDSLSMEAGQFLYFLLCFTNETRFQLGTLKRVPGMVAAIRLTDPISITVVGHADTLGTEGWNAGLSIDRALAAKELLVSYGIDPAIIKTFGQGEESLLVPTRDEVREPRNRCVEVIVR